ncbi:MAG: methyltransferase domain-containing protein, partial [Candidatus Omnitrophica bacterium]|nr:methyltransferase domain-containing protein [Candidatus Omnitrophota bacterium]
MKKTKCIVCAGIDLNELIRFDRYPLCIGVLPPELLGKVKSFPLSIGRCNDCSHIQQLNPIADDHKKILYEDKYSGLLSTVLTPSKGEVGLVETEKSFNFFMGCGLPRGKVLDIGCYDGYFLSLLKEQGYAVRGIEPNPAGSIAEKKYGIPVIKDFFSDRYFKPESIDIIVIRNILEHMSNVNDFLKSVVTILKPGGHIFIEVPNVLSSFKEGALGCFFHQHLSYFSLEVLLYLLSRYSLEHVSSCEDYFIYLCVRKNKENARRSSVVNKRAYRLNKEVDAYFSKFEKRRLDLMKLLGSEDKVAIFGAGGNTTGLIHMLGRSLSQKIKYVYDNNKLKHGNLLAELPLEVKAPELMKEDKPNFVVISTYLHQKAIVE